MEYTTLPTLLLYLITHHDCKSNFLHYNQTAVPCFYSHSRIDKDLQTLASTQRSYTMTNLILFHLQTTGWTRQDTEDDLLFVCCQVAHEMSSGSCYNAEYLADWAAICHLSKHWRHASFCCLQYHIDYLPAGLWIVVYTERQTKIPPTTYIF